MAIRLFKRKKKKEKPTVDDAVVETVAAVDADEEPAELEAATEPWEEMAVEEPDAVPLSEEDADTPAKAKSGGFFKRLKRGLTKTRDFLTTDIDALFSGGGEVDAEMLEDLEGLLITADLGVQTTAIVMDRIEKRSGKLKNAGVNIVVAGSYVYGSNNYGEAIKSLQI